MIPFTYFLFTYLFFFSLFKDHRFLQLYQIPDLRSNKLGERKIFQQILLLSIFINRTLIASLNQS